MTLTHNGHNALADSCNPRRDLGDRETEHGGLSTVRAGGDRGDEPGRHAGRCRAYLAR